MRELPKKIYLFLKGTVDVTPNTDIWSSDPFFMVLNSYDHNGWGVTKAISDDEAKGMTEKIAKDFYVTSLGLLGISAE
ncbi:hypothetical protein JI57_04640 [Psychromonas sp. PRT-SC03]|nr:hypothetical protein JI57_04640 [Psychromonas sp. PRT-SC03]